MFHLTLVIHQKSKQKYETHSEEIFEYIFLYKLHVILEQRLLCMFKLV